MTEITIMGFHFQYSYKNGLAHFRDLGGGGGGGVRKVVQEDIGIGDIGKKCEDSW